MRTMFLGAHLAAAAMLIQNQIENDLIGAIVPDAHETAHRRYRYHYDRHVIDYRDYLHAEHTRKLRESQEAEQRARDAHHINAAEAKRLRKQAKRKQTHERQTHRSSQPGTG